MDGLLEDPDLDVFLTWDVQRLPAYGPKVVAVVLGDEAARVPRYRDRVRAVFKCYGARPSARLRPRGWWDRPSPAELLEWLVDWSRWLPSGVRSLRSATPLAVIPLGTYNQLDLPVVPMEERGTDVFFAGSVDHDGASVLRRR